MTTLIAGGCGFIGLNVAQACLERGQNVVLLDRNAPPAAAREAFDALRGTWVHEAVDVTSETAVTDVFQRHAVDEVFYGAAITSGAQREREHPEQVLAVNLLGLAHVIKAAAARGVRRLINLSSGSAYGEGGLARCGATGPLDEAVSRPEPATLYGVTKLASEGMCRRLGALTGLDTVSVRLAIIFGPWELDSGFRDTLSAPMQAGFLALRGENGQRATARRPGLDLQPGRGPRVAGADGSARASPRPLPRQRRAPLLGARLVRCPDAALSRIPRSPRRTRRDAQRGAAR